MTGAGWYADPIGRAQVRYFDGTEWSQWVADDGNARLDAEVSVTGLPVPPPLPPPGPAASPLTTASWAPDAVAAPRRPFAPLRGLTTALTWLLATAMVGSAAVVVASLNRIDVVNRIERGEFVSPSDRTNARDAVSGSRSFLYAVALAVFVLFIMFLYRAVQNTELWSTARARWTRGWAIGGWFIPVAFYVIPLLVVLEVWRRSATDDGAGRRRSTSSRVVWLWWLCFIVGWTAVSVVDSSADSLDDLQNHDAVATGAAALLIAAGAFMIVVVRRLSAWQRARADAARVI